VSRFLVLAALLALLASPALAQSGPYPSYHNSAKVTAAHSVIQYFNYAGNGLTSTAANRQEVQHLSLYNAHTAELEVRVYTMYSPGWDGVWSANSGDDYVKFLVPAGATLTLPDICAIGLFCVTNPTSNGLYIYGWNGRP
jgi:hypothetical protein